MKLSKPAITLTFAATLLLTACGGNEYGQPDNEYEGNNTRQIGYNQTTDDPMRDRANNRDQTRDGQGNSGNLNENNRSSDQYMFDRDNNRDTNDRENNRNNEQGNNNNEYDVATDVADKVESDIPEIDNVYVLTTENNAYVAAAWDKEDDLDDKTKDKITKSVKSVNKDIENVYVSTNPDFVELANQYADDIDKGDPVEGFFGRIGNMIERVFPENKE